MLLIIQDTLFFLALSVFLVLPGYALLEVLRLYKHGSFKLSPLEHIALSVPVSFGLSTGITLLFDILSFPIRTYPIALVVCIVSVGLWWWGRNLAKGVSQVTSKKSKKEHKTPNTSRPKVSAVFIGLIVSLIVVKTVFVAAHVLPDSTDLGHHMYWAKYITRAHELPDYESRQIVSDGTNHEITDPTSISDFVIGEHIIFALVGQFSGKDFTGAFPVLVLFVVHIVTLLLLYVLTRHIVRAVSSSSDKNFSALRYVPELTLFLYGLLYAIGSPQIKYVTGGVVGNTLGFMLLMAIFFCILYSVRYKNTSAMVVGFFLVMGLAYTHHLSALIFVCILLASLLMLLIFNRKVFFTRLFPVVFSREVLISVALGIFMFFVLWTPSYIKNTAVDTVVGAQEVEKIEHMGLSLAQFMYVISEGRFVFGVIGVIIVLFIRPLRRSVGGALVLGWFWVLTLITLKPDILGLSLPSGRVANYVIPVFAILSVVTISWMIVGLKKVRVVSPSLRFVSTVLFLLFFFYGGTSDNQHYVNALTYENSHMRSVHEGARFLRSHIPKEDNIVHDHINIIGDSWIKLEFMKGYNYPFYRAHLFRYDRVTDRQEKCTLYSVTSPNSPEAIDCRDALNLRAFYVDETFDGIAFEKSDAFNRVYSNGLQSVYYNDTRL